MVVRTPAIVAGLVGAGVLALAVRWWWAAPRVDRQARGVERSARLYRSGLAAGLGFIGIGLAAVGIGYLGTVRRLERVSGHAIGDGSGTHLATIGEAIPRPNSAASFSRPAF